MLYGSSVILLPVIHTCILLGSDIKVCIFYQGGQMLNLGIAGFLNIGIHDDHRLLYWDDDDYLHIYVEMSID